jgi:hypothetical protein
MIGSPEVSLHYSMLETQFETALSPVAAFEELLSFPGSYIYNPVVVI